MEFGGKKVMCLKQIRGYNTGEERGGSRHSFARQTMLLSIIYLLSYLSKGLFEVKDK